jgi:aminopeptidase-like protein
VAVATAVDLAASGAAMHDLISRLYPICRSITGDGVRETLAVLGERIPLEIHEVPSGTQVFDWQVPREWNIRDAYVARESGERVIDFRESCLHVVGYSVPVRKTVTLAELKEHLFSLPDRPGWIPYRTSYYEESWGFCLAHEDLRRLTDASYEVCIDASLEDGHLVYGECFIPGELEDEFLVSAHVCHPSLCNDNLSGIAVATFLAREVARRPRRYSYRFLFAPATIGAITWLALNEDRADRIKHGLVLSCVGDAGRSTYKRSRRGKADIDRAMRHVLNTSNDDFDVLEFSPYGYDERQFCSPGFDLPVGCLMRTPWGHFPEYHTSADDLTFVKPEALADSLEKCVAALGVIEANRRYRSRNPKGEPQLGRRGVYGTLGGERRKDDELALLWVLNLSDRGNSLLDIAERSGLEFGTVARAADVLLEHDLLEAVE